MVDGESTRDAREGSLQDLDSKLLIALERAGHAIRTSLRGRAIGAGLTLTQAEILLRLARGRIGHRRVGALAREFDVRQPTVSDAVAALERKGLIARRVNPDDARSVELAVTEAGAALAEDLAGAEEAARTFFERRDEGEKEVALNLLVELIAELNRVGAIEVARTCPTCRFFRSADGGPPHCALLDMTLAPGDIRVDCPEHEPLTSGA